MAGKRINQESNNNNRVVMDNTLNKELATQILHDECGLPQDVAAAMAYMCGMINDYRTNERQAEQRAAQAIEED